MLGSSSEKVEATAGPDLPNTAMTNESSDLGSIQAFFEGRKSVPVIGHDLLITPYG